MNRKTAKALDYLVGELHPKLAEAFKPDTCILQSRLAAGAMRANGVIAKPMPCSLLAANATWLKLAADGKPPLSLPDSWAVGVGAAPPDGSVSVEQYEQSEVGHVILLGPDWFLDMTADQAARPAKAIPMRSFWAPTGREQLRLFEAERQALEAEIGEDARVQYAAKPHRKETLLKSPDWRLRGKRQGPWMDEFVRAAEREAIERVRKALR